MAQTRFLVSIPTLNSAKTIGLAIDSFKTQDFRSSACNIVDSYSTDGTQEIAKSKGIEVKLYRGKLLGARHKGFADQECEYVLFMDSDQVLGKELLSRLDHYLREHQSDMVILGEHSYSTDTWVKKMYELDRTIVQKDYEYNLSPEHGVLLPRVFKKTLLEQAFKNIDSKLLPKVTAHDHAIIYFECYKISNSIGYLEDAIYHQELATLRSTYSHFVSYGRNTKRFKKLGLYNDLIKSKMSGRTAGFSRGIFGRKVLTLPLLAAKAAGYYRGYFFEK